MIFMQNLHELIKRACNGETKNKENEDIGESDLVSLLIKTLYGGSIIRIISGKKTHYCNATLGRIVDYSGDKIENYTLTPEEITEINEEELLEDEKIRARYLTFLENIQRILKESYKEKIKNDSTLNASLRNKKYTDIEVTDYFDAGAYEFVSFSLLGSLGRVSFEYMRDKEDKQIFFPRKVAKEKAKYKTLPQPTVERVFYLARENSDPIQKSKTLEKTIKSIVED